MSIPVPTHNMSMQIRGQFTRLGSFLPPSGSQGLNSGFQDWQQACSLTELACQPVSLCLYPNRRDGSQNLILADPSHVPSRFSLNSTCLEIWKKIDTHHHHHGSPGREGRKALTSLAYTSLQLERKDWNSIHRFPLGSPRANLHLTWPWKSLLNPGLVLRGITKNSLPQGLGTLITDQKLPSMHIPCLPGEVDDGPCIPDPICPHVLQGLISVLFFSPLPYQLALLCVVTFFTQTLLKYFGG